MKEVPMRAFIATVILVASLAVATTAHATQNRTTTINAALVGNGCGVTGLECGSGGGGSCVCLSGFWNFAGRTTIPALGTLSFAGSYSDGYFCSEIGEDFNCLVPLTYTRSLTLIFTAHNGDKLVLAEEFSSSTRPPLLIEGDNPVGGEWSVDPAQSTGRFTHYSGSGTYSLNYQDQQTYATFTLTLQGALTFR
jgi:hypothetical protein